ncbi:MAG: ABC transporter substrate-binding protein [Candidatus Bathyarchaeota archaeon]|nr:ABC transporter substrate-binding protein [Candidatus Bathyarchaeota archaeon]
MSRNIVDKKAVTKIQTTILAAIIIVAAVAGVVYYVTLPSGEEAEPSLTITDYAGRTVKINGTIQTIASSYPIATEAILFLGGEEKMCGADSSCIGNSFMNTLYPKLGDTTDLGYPWNTNVEQVVDLAPSVFVASGTSEETADQLTELGVPTVCLSFETPEDFNQALTIIGKLIDNEAAAESTVEYYSDMAQTIQSKTEGLAESSKPSVMFISYGAQRKYTLKTPGEGMLQNNLIEMCGGVSVSADQPGGWNEISMEQVALWDPDVVIITSYASNVSTTDLKNEIMADDTWNVTTAKIEGKIYAFAQDWGSWDSPTPKWILGTLWIGKFIQPALFDSMDLTQTATDFYQTFYDITYEQASVTGDM